METQQFSCNIEAIHRYIENLRKTTQTLAVPFHPIYWSTNQIFYNCEHCYKGNRLKSGEIPYYCNHPEFLSEYIRTGAKITRCINCPFYQQR